MAMYDALDIAAMAEEEAKKLGLPPNLYKKVVLTGENYDAKTIDSEAVSPKGAKGPAQVIDATWEGLIKNGKIPADANRSDVRTNLRAGALVLKEQFDMAGGNQAAAVAGYNAGNQANKDVASGKMPAAKETQEYLARLGLSPDKPFLDNNDPGTPTGLVLARATTKGGTPEQKEASTAELSRLIESNRVATERFKEALFGGATNLQTAAKATIDQGLAAADTVTVQGAIDVAKMAQTQQINSVLNVSVRDPDSVIVESQRKRREAQIKMDALRPVIDAEDRIQVWDDPLRWIANQFTLPNLKREYNAANREQSIMTKRMAETQQLASAQQAVDPAIVIEDIGRVAASKASEIKFKTLAEASKLQANSAEYLARAVNEDMVVNNRSWDQRMQLSRQFQESLSYARTTENDKKLTAQEKQLQGTVDVLNTKLVGFLGMPAIDVGTLKTLGQQRAGELIDWAQLPTMGNGPGESMAAVRKFGSTANVYEKNPILFKFIDDITRSADYKAIEGVKKADQRFQQLPLQEQKEILVQETFYKQLKDLEVAKGSGEVTANNLLPSSNPYKLKHTVSTQVPALTNNEFVKEVPLLMATSADKKTVDDQALLNSFVGKVAAEPNKVAIHAKELSEYYQKSAEYQWARGGAAITGYPKPKTYGIAITEEGNKVVNVMSPLELEAYAIRKMSAMLLRQSNTSVWGAPVNVNGQDFTFN